MARLPPSVTFTLPVRAVITSVAVMLRSSNSLMVMESPVVVRLPTLVFTQTLPPLIEAFRKPAVTWLAKAWRSMSPEAMLRVMFADPAWIMPLPSMRPLCTWMVMSPLFVNTWPTSMPMSFCSKIVSVSPEFVMLAARPATPVLMADEFCAVSVSRLP